MRRGSRERSGPALAPSRTRLIDSTPHAMPTSMVPAAIRSATRWVACWALTALGVDRRWRRCCSGKPAVQPGPPGHVVGLLAGLGDAAADDLLDQLRGRRRRGRSTAFWTAPSSSAACTPGRASRLRLPSGVRTASTMTGLPMRTRLEHVSVRLTSEDAAMPFVCGGACLLGTRTCSISEELIVQCRLPQPARRDSTSDPTVNVRGACRIDELAELRKTAPVWWFEQPSGKGGFNDGGYWAVSKHADVAAVSRSNDASPAGQNGAIIRFARDMTRDDVEHAARHPAQPGRAEHHDQLRQHHLPRLHPARHRAAARRPGPARPATSSRPPRPRVRATSSRTSPASCRCRRSPTCSASRRRTAASSSTGPTR